MGDERLLDVFNRALLLTMTARFLESEYGEGALEALAEWKEGRSRERWRRIAEETGRGDPEYLLRLFTDRVHEFEVIRCDREVLEVRVTRCAYADAFRELGAPEVGHRMICMGDHAVVEGFNPETRFSRPGTLMEGGDCCHFRFELDR